MKASELNLVRVGKGAYICFYTSDLSGAMSAVDTLRGTDIEVSIDRYREKRSLSSNAYFHVLAAKIAAKTSKSLTEVKRSLVTDYGVIARTDGGEIAGAMLPSGVDPLIYHDYPRWIKDKDVDGKTWSCWIFMKRTSDMNTDEMSKLIDGTVTEAKQLGIETMTPDEINAMFERERHA